MDIKPKRICSQKVTQATCVYCTFHNILQEQVYPSPCQFLSDFETISRSKGLIIQPGYWDNDGITSDTLKLLLSERGYLIRKKRTRLDIMNGWAEFDLVYNGSSFLHAVAIRDGYLIDSIEIPNNGDGIYFWDGHLYGYEKEKMIALYEIEK